MWRAIVWPQLQPYKQLYQTRQDVPDLYCLAQANRRSQIYYQGQQTFGSNAKGIGAQKLLGKENAASHRDMRAVDLIRHCDMRVFRS